MSNDSLYYSFEYDDSEPLSADEVRDFLRREGAGWAEATLEDGWTRFLADVPLPGASSRQLITVLAAGQTLDEILALGGTLCGAWEDGR